MQMSNDEPNQSGVVRQDDLAECDRQQIHILGQIQPFGVLIAVSSDWIISHVSENCAEILNKPPGEVLGSPLAEHIDSGTLHELRNGMANLRSAEGSARIAGTTIGARTSRYDVTCHVSKSNILFEFEPASNPEAGEANIAFIRGAMARLNKIDSLQGVLDYSVRLLQRITGFDRVMAYKFLADGSGEVVAEARNADVDSFLGLRYPASDIPKQARALYVLNPIRSIADVAAEQVDIVPPANLKGERLDLSQSVLRSVAPIHLEYLRNMGVAASMSASIIRDGELWGLFACHHHTPLLLSPLDRNAVELFGQLVSLLLQQRAQQQAFEDAQKAELAHQRILSLIAAKGRSTDQFQALLPEFRQMIEQDGIAICVGGVVILDGATPSKEEITGLLRILNAGDASEIAAIESISSIYPQAKDFVDRAAGLLAIPVSRTPRDYLIFFRREIARSIVWAGNPDKAATLEQGSIRISPRKSFAAYRQMVSGRCEPWTGSEVRLANALRTTLLEVVLKLTDAADEHRRKSMEKQELLISELNHRVRNLLGLVRGLINQTKMGAVSTEQYVNVLDQRVQALARAHDQITKQNWSPGSLRSLIELEADAYVQSAASRIRVSGPDVLLQPVAFSAMALVVHELMTNAAKYGALCDGSGTVDVTLETDPAGQLTMTWVESGGPPVKEPNRRGFGTTIIERSIPFELKGRSDVSYARDGLRAGLVIPAQYVVAATETNSGAAASKDQRDSQMKTGDVGEMPARVLLVEDNIILAMDAEGFLLELGAKTVEVVPSVDQAIEALNRQKPDLGFLDVNLGNETSLAVADWLKKNGVPYLFATGYGDQAVLGSAHENVPRISKPYDQHSIRAAILDALARKAV